MQQTNMACNYGRKYRINFVIFLFFFTQYWRLELRILIIMFWHSVFANSILLLSAFTLIDIVVSAAAHGSRAIHYPIYKQIYICILQKKCTFTLQRYLKLRLRQGRCSDFSKVVAKQINTPIYTPNTHICIRDNQVIYTLYA